VTKLLAMSAAVAAVAALASADTARSTEAITRNDAPSEVVKFDRAQLSTQSGADALYERIRTAAWRVCSAMYSGPEALERLKCIKTLTADAVKDVNSPMLSALYEEKTGQRVG
jgi:UrcA family protein